MKRLLAAAVFGMVVLAGCASLPRGYESMSYELGPGWKVGHEAEIPGQYFIIEFIREGDDIKSWKELVTVQNFSLPQREPSPQQALAKLREMREQECPGSTIWNVIAEDEKSVLYEWQAKLCLGWLEQHEIAKIIDGKYNRFRIAYTVKEYQLSPERRATWIDIITQAKIKQSTISTGETTFSIIEATPLERNLESVVPGYAGKAHAEDVQQHVRERIFQTDHEKSADCKTREVVNTLRAAPTVLQEGRGRRLAHELER